MSDETATGDGTAASAGGPEESPPAEAELDEVGLATGTAGGREIDRRPARTSTVAAVLAAMVAMATVALVSITAAALTAGGGVVFGIGAVSGSRRSTDAGTALLLAGVLVAGASGVGAPALLVATGATIVARDLAGNARTLGLQLGRAADTRRAEAVHAAGSCAVGVATAGIGYGLFLSLSGSRPLAALAFAMLAVVVLVSLLRL